MSPDNQYFQIKAILEATKENSPTLHSITISLNGSNVNPPPFPFYGKMLELLMTRICNEFRLKKASSFLLKRNCAY